MEFIFFSSMMRSLTRRGPRVPETETETGTAMRARTGSATGAVGKIERGTGTGRVSVNAVKGAGIVSATIASTVKGVKEGSTVTVSMTVTTDGAVIVTLKGTSLLISVMSLCILLH